MFRSWVVLLLIGCAALVAAHPHHYDFDEDLEALEKGLDDIADAEEDEEEDEETDSSVDSQVGSLTMSVTAPKLASLLLVLDCGSSGTKFMVYAPTLGDCPQGLPPNPTGRAMEVCDEGLKFLPTMRDITLGDWTSDWSVTTSGTTRLERTGLKPHFDRVDQIVAYATAGNRIIPVGKNTTAWANLKSAIRSRYSKMDLSETGTIPGTMEAWFEYRGSGGNFVSMGGASAQFGVLLDHLHKLTKWSLVIKRASGSLSVSNCNNQDDINHFFTTISDPDDYTSIVPRSQFASKCAKGNCVGLASWLSIRQLAGLSGKDGKCATGYSGNPSSPGYVNHWTGGVDESLEGFKAYITALSKQGDCYGTSSDAKKCAELMVRFSRFDRTTENLKRFMQGLHAVSLDYKPMVLAALKGALKIYKGYGDEGTLTAALKSTTDGTAGTARFAMWGVQGIIVASWSIPTDGSGSFLAFGGASTLSGDGATWAQRIADDKKYPVLCPIVNLREPNAISNGVKSCQVNLGIDES